MLAILSNIREIWPCLHLFHAIQPSKERPQLNNKRMTDHSEILAK